MGILDALFGAKADGDEPADEPSWGVDAEGHRWYAGAPPEEWGYGEVDDDDGDEGEAISVYDAADIYFSSGFDEDRMFGYSHEELEDAHEAGG